MTGIDRAKALLAATTFTGRCTGPKGTAANCPKCQASFVREQIEDMAPDTLRVLIGAAEALEKMMSEADPGWKLWAPYEDRVLADTPIGQGRKALAELEKLFPEEGS
jgi:hypothetical protein